MSLLLDTHVLLWVATDSPRLSPRARSLLLDDATELWFSAVSIWEVAIKRGLDRPDFQIDPGALRKGLLGNGYRELAMDGRHCLPLLSLPALHGDAFDRMLRAQAQIEALTLMTADAKLARYPGAILHI